jgi:hypothetical protein
MKGMILSTMMAVTGTVALAQPVAGGAVGPVAGGAVPFAAGAGLAITNAKPDLAKVQVVSMELGRLNKELGALETKLQMADPDLKLLAEKRNAAYQVANDLEEQRKALLENKLMSDPTVKPLVEKRRELRNLWKEIRPAGGPMGGPASHKRPPLDGAGPKILPAPAATPAVTEKPAEAAKPK